MARSHFVSLIRAGMRPTHTRRIRLTNVYVGLMFWYQCRLCYGFDTLWLAADNICYFPQRIVVTAFTLFSNLLRNPATVGLLFHAHLDPARLRASNNSPDCHIVSIWFLFCAYWHLRDWLRMRCIFSLGCIIHVLTVRSSQFATSLDET